MEKNFLLRSGQLYPSLGSLYKYNLGISSLLRERIARFMNADEESASEMDNNHIINNLLYGDHGGPEESLVAELFANESYGTAFEFHESREDLDRILNGDPEKRFRRPLSVYDLGENCWGMVSERKEELALRDELEKTLDSSRKVELWQKIRELNKKANFLEEALLEENPSKRQRQMKDDARPMLLQNLIEYMHSGSHFYAFEALPRISIKGGHPHKALIQQHFLEEKVKLPTPRVAHSFAILRFAPEWGIWETKADTNRK